MKKFLALILLITLTGLLNSCGQTGSNNFYNSSSENKDGSLVDSNGSVADGTTMGYFQILNGNDTLILDFQATDLILTIDENEDLAYEHLPKLFITSTTDGKTFLEYQTQLLSNILSIELNGTKYSSGVFDDAKDIQVPGLSVNSVSDKNIEYLSLYVTEPLLLSTAYQFPKSQGNEYESYKPVKAITVLPGSNIIFKMKK
jgi:hypothetical protein